MKRECCMGFLVVNNRFITKLYRPYCFDNVVFSISQIACYYLIIRNSPLLKSKLILADNYLSLLIVYCAR